MKLILPKTHPDIESYGNLPLFFLAGPIQGGGDWHVHMSQLLETRFGECIIVNPSRYPDNHILYGKRLKGQDDYFDHQTDWERYYLQQAAEEWPKGCIIIWLPVENTLNPRDDGDPYAMDTRGEIGEWRGRMMHNRHLRIVIGGDPDFPGLRTIQRNNATALKNKLPIHNTMQEVVNAAFSLMFHDSVPGT